MFLVALQLQLAHIKAFPGEEEQIEPENLSLRNAKLLKS
jgi:hypothetical protein